MSAKIIAGTIIVLVLGVFGFYALNAYIYNEKQGDGVTEFRDGEYLGFIHAVVDNNTRMDFDDGVWLTGRAAEDAAIEAGICTEATRRECVPSGFFIKNESIQDEQLTLSPNARVFMQTWMMEETGEVSIREISRADFAELINDPSKHWRDLPYRITVLGTNVIQIEEVYVP